ncbi:hypothetical protein [uncultured Ruegeria sp.]|uniref:hypothetical protein n=1 Tax=uncultured Ruegeria sp. TaxID=259304 RepID=UPI00262BE07D|nr:hypothetical protein [uncultured Ruegeria sp.]
MTDFSKPGDGYVAIGKGDTCLTVFTSPGFHEFTVPENGKYRIEGCGAGEAGSSNTGGRAGEPFVEELDLNTNDIIECSVGKGLVRKEGSGGGTSTVVRIVRAA